MERQHLISEVKEKYAALASMASQETSSFQQVNEPSAEKYYEALLQTVIDGILDGKFDEFHSGSEIVDAVANDKSKWLK